MQCILSVYHIRQCLVCKCSRLSVRTLRVKDEKLLDKVSITYVCFSQLKALAKTVDLDF